MKLVIGAAAVRLIGRWVEAGLIVGGVSAFAFCAVTLTESARFQGDQEQRMNEEIGVRSAGLAQKVRAGAAAVESGRVGRIEIPRLHLSAIVMEGSDAKTLRHAVGHVRGTSLPGGTGNVVLSAHRDTFFWPLREIRNDDVIRVVTADGEYEYRVARIQVVAKEEVGVMASRGRATLTLITCYPFYFTGPAPRRFIVSAEPALETAAEGRRGRH